MPLFANGQLIFFQSFLTGLGQSTGSVFGSYFATSAINKIKETSLSSRRNKDEKPNTDNQDKDENVCKSSSKKCHVKSPRLCDDTCTDE